ncbi:MAG: hypothetical protein OXD33_06595 [Rhodobacteraceae bacterium]|nr:hypothetical protein [Paracoccaceae bacterium]
MQVGLRHFDSLTLDWLAVALRSGGLSRHALGRGLCARTDWCDARGQPCLSAAAKALPGVKKVWQGLERLNWGIQVRNALGEKQLE